MTRRQHTTPSLRIGISQCLLGDHVRYDGGHKRDAFLVDTVSRYVEWVPVCPEVEAGLGVPREPMQLEGTAVSPRLVTITTHVDHTRVVNRFSAQRLRELEDMDLCGYVFKARSPSCGISGVPVHHRSGIAHQDGIGLFAQAFRLRFPLIPVEDEERLKDPVVLQNFLERVRAYQRLKKRAGTSSKPS